MSDIHFLIMPEEKRNQEEHFAPSISPEERSALEEYKSKDRESPSQQTHICQHCNKEFSTIDGLTAHYKEDHPESF
jgi:hypothetical protein